MAFLLSSLVAPYVAVIVVALVALASTMGGQNHITGKGKYS